MQRDNQSPPVYDRARDGCEIAHRRVILHFPLLLAAPKCARCECVPSLSGKHQRICDSAHFLLTSNVTLYIRPRPNPPLPTHPSFLSHYYTCILFPLIKWQHIMHFTSGVFVYASVCVCLCDFQHRIVVMKNYVCHHITLYMATHIERAHTHGKKKISITAFSLRLRVRGSRGG